MQRINRIKNYLIENCGGYTLLAFSGGIDSTILLKLLSELKEIKTIAVTFETQLHPKNEVEACRKLAKEYQVDHKVIKIDEFKNEEILKNPPNRCYLCKKDLFLQLDSLRKQYGYSTIMDGTNFDDTLVYRPGLKALEELAVLSPLKALGIKKIEIREMAKELGIKIFDKPSAPCLATRLPYGDRIEIGILNKIETGEGIIKDLGFLEVRLRLHSDIVRIELPKKDLDKFINYSNQITKQLKELGFKYITLDLEGFRSGSMDEVLNV